ncbi:hypothetical protein EJ110_NYTH40733 [Nymphaea thermarum]|nr:hypothetical protein EJ110_NYTH40733 [Nymphaea thermarum]
MAGGSDGVGGLVGMCIEAACISGDSVEAWRRQRRTLQMLPAHLAHALFRCLLDRKLIVPSLLECASFSSHLVVLLVFQYSVEVVDLKGKSFVDAEWMAYIGAYRSLRVLNLAECKGINNSSLWSITGMTCLRELNLSRCTKISNDGMQHLKYVQDLRKLSLSETAVTAAGITCLSSLVNLTFLDLGGLPITDASLGSLQGLTKLEHLDLWGSEISNKGAANLKGFPSLSFINLAWTKVTVLPCLSSLKCLNLSNCTVDSMFDGYKAKVPLSRLIFAGSMFNNPLENFSCLDTEHLYFLDVSCSSFHDFCFLNKMSKLTYLDLSSGNMSDAMIDPVAAIGANLRNLNLGNTRVTTVGVAALAGAVPKLETLSLSRTCIDDAVLYYLGMMPALRMVNLSNTSIKGLIHQGDHVNFSLTAVQDLEHLENLDLGCTQIRDLALEPLSNLKQLRCLSLDSDFLSDVSLHSASPADKLKVLSIRNAVLTDVGLLSFVPPPTLHVLDLSGCWLLTVEGISQFCKFHPRITVRHEAIDKLSEEQNNGLKQKSGALCPPTFSAKMKHRSKFKEKSQKETWRGKRPFQIFFDIFLVLEKSAIFLSFDNVEQMRELNTAGRSCCSYNLQASCLSNLSQCDKEILLPKELSTKPPNSVGGRRRVSPGRPAVARRDGRPSSTENRPESAGFPSLCASAPFLTLGGCNGGQKPPAGHPIAWVAADGCRP